LHGTGKFLLPKTTPNSETYLPHEPRARFYDANTGKYSNNEGRRVISTVTLLNSITGKIGYKGSGNTGYPGQRLYDDILTVMRKLFKENVWTHIDYSQASIRDESGTWDDYLLNAQKTPKCKAYDTYNRIRIFRAQRGGNEGQYIPFWEGLWYNGPCEAYVYKFTTDPPLEEKQKTGETAVDDGEEEDEEHDKSQPAPDLVKAVRDFDWIGKPDDRRCVFSVPALLRPYPLTDEEMNALKAVDKDIESDKGFRRLLKKKKDAEDEDKEDPEDLTGMSWPHMMYTISMLEDAALKDPLQKRKVRSARTEASGFALLRAYRIRVVSQVRMPDPPGFACAHAGSAPSRMSGPLAQGRAAEA
jgi:hypothetical protein